MTDHETVRAALEVACAEPGGLDRLEAADTAEAALVVSHLVGCPTCAEELGRLHRTDALLRPLLAAAPSSALRARTLDLVREVGRDRSAPSRVGPASVVSAAVAPASAAPEPLAIHEPDRPGTVRSQGWSRRPVAWFSSIAAALVLGILGGALLGGSLGRPAGTGDPAVALAAVTRDASHLLAAHDVLQVNLVDSTGAAGGTLLLSPSQGRMLAVAADLPDPGVGRVYRCWVATASGRITLGTMWRAGGVAWWSGDVTLPANLPYDVVYGVSLVDPASPGAASDVLTGHLESKGS